MAKRAYDEKHIKAVADRIRHYTGGKKKYKVRELANGIDDVALSCGAGSFDNRLDGIIALQNGYIGGGYKPSEGLEYCFDENSYSVRGIGSCADEVVVIPPEYEGYPVTSIETLESKTMKELILPDSVTWIASTINGCTALERVVFGANFGAINYWAFEGNVNCKVYDFSRCLQIPTIDLYDDPMYSVFSDMPDDCKIIVPAHLLDDWKRATNWTMFADHIVAAESVDDNGTSDEVYNTTEERLETIEGNVSKVYEAGSDTGFEAGKQAEWNAFWDGFQDYGNRTEYNMTFRKWNDAIFKPKYDIRPIDATQIFNGTNIKDIAGALRRAGVVLDFSQCTTFRMAFYTAVIEYIPVVDTRAATDDSANGALYYLFASTTILKSIEKIILKPNGSQVFNGTFHWLPNLEEVRFEGVIGQNGLVLKDSTKLSKASIENIISCLSTTTSGLAVTLSKTAKEAAFTTDEWSALIATKPNWTISLI
jgi:hypothetical protein